MHRRAFLKTTGAAGIIIFLQASELHEFCSQDSSATLEENFQQPPSAAYPQVLWFWMNGNITKEGITLDLEAMKRVGIGGVLNFDVGTGIPKGPVEYLSDEWTALKEHAINEAARLGLEFTMHNCPGWSSSGGPWITPELAMQQISWSETYVPGGSSITVYLPKPANRLNFYKDIAVIGFPSLEGEELLQTVRLSSSNRSVIDKTLLSGKEQEGVVVLPSNGEAWLQFEFDRPYEATLLTFFISAPSSDKSQTIPVEFGQSTSILFRASDDGIHFRDIVRINTGLETELLISDKFIVFDIPATKAKYFRFVSSEPRRYKQVQFSGITRLKNWMEKTNHRARNFMYVAEPSTVQTTNNQQVPKGSVIDSGAVEDLTANMDKEGLLTWNVPAGNWTILRIGFTPTGTINRAAPDAGVGLECDKYNADAISFHFSKMMENLLPATKELAMKKKMGLEIDSYEANSQNWTPGFEKQFQSKWGYSIASYLPVLAGGRIIDGIDITERFLWDLRRLQADLIAENYYGKFVELCHQHGMTAYCEPYESGPFEEMQIGSKADINMGEFWNGIPAITPAKTPVLRTPKLVSAIAHINNQNVAGAEAFTSEPDSGRWQAYPFAMKALGDKIFATGINRMIIHRFAHQPHPTAMPGMTMGPWGIHFDRTNTWWNPGKAWLNYLSRCQYLLQQGHAVADLLYFTGEDANMYTQASRDDLYPRPPEGYDYDLVNAEAILKKARINNNKIELGNGNSYRVLVLQNFKGITFWLLKSLKQLVHQGLVLVGERPERSVGLSNYKEEDKEFHEILNELWGDESRTNNEIGNGKVLEGPSLLPILQGLNIHPDFEYSSRSGDAPVLYIHRKIDDADVYFLTNQRRSFEEVVGTFRVKNKQPEIWDPVTGKTTIVWIYELAGDRVRVPLQLTPYGSMFVIFRKAASPIQWRSVEKDHEPILSTGNFPASPRKLYTKIANDFTIVFKAKPEINILLNPDFILGSIVHPWTEYYAIYPPTGSKLYGNGNATCGIAVGRNGIAVWENENGVPNLVLPVPVPVSGWSTVAVKYEDGLPSVYLNRQLIKKGIKSPFNVHPAIDKVYLNEGASYYNGDITKPVLYDRALHDNEIRNLPDETNALASSPFVIEPAGTNKPSFRVKRNGSYTFRNKKNESRSFVVNEINEPSEITGPWKVKFPAGLGAPDEIILPQLISLHKNEQDGVKYFSGTASYTVDFFLNKNPLNKHWLLDLGSVEVMAEVDLNGKNLGVLWTRPFQVDVTNAIEKGMNKLTVKVTNLWPNRLIGDEQLPDPDKFSPGGNGSGREALIGGYIQQLPEWYVVGKPKPDNGRICFTTWKHYIKTSPLLESGLIGPVILSEAVIITV